MNLRDCPYEEVLFRRAVCWFQNRTVYVWYLYCKAKLRISGRWVTKVQWKLYYPCLTLTSLLRRNNHVMQGQASWKYRQALCDRLLIFMQKSKTTKPLHLSIFVLQQLVTNGLAHWFLLPPSPLYSRKNKIQFPNSGIRKKSKLQPRPSLQNKYPLFS